MIYNGVLVSDVQQSESIIHTHTHTHTHIYIIYIFPGGSDGKASACKVGDPGSIPGVGKILCRRKWQPTPVWLLGNLHGWRNKVGYGP